MIHDKFSTHSYIESASCHCHRPKSAADFSPLVIAPRRARFQRSHLQIRATAIAYQLDASIYSRERSSQARCLLDWSPNTLTLKGHYTNLRPADRRTQKNTEKWFNTRIKCVQRSTWTLTITNGKYSILHETKKQLLIRKLLKIKIDRRGKLKTRPPPPKFYESRSAGQTGTKSLLYCSQLIRDFATLSEIAIILARIYIYVTAPYC